MIIGAGVSNRRAIGCPNFRTGIINIITALLIRTNKALWPRTCICILIPRRGKNTLIACGFAIEISRFCGGPSTVDILFWNLPLRTIPVCPAPVLYDWTVSKEIIKAKKVVDKAIRSLAINRYLPATCIPAKRNLDSVRIIPGTSKTGGIPVCILYFDNINISVRFP